MFEIMTLHRYPPWSSGIAPAPGDLRVVQAFVNTLDVETGEDEAATPELLAGWLARWSLLPPEVAVDEPAWRRAIDLREGLRALLLGHHGDPVDPEVIQRLEAVVRDVPLVLRFRDGGTARLAPSGRGFTAALGRLLAIVSRAEIDGSWQRLKVCANDACRWAFYDASKNRSGKWCSMSRCGNLIKARAYRRRKLREVRGATDSGGQQLSADNGRRYREVLEEERRSRQRD